MNRTSSPSEIAPVRTTAVLLVLVAVLAAGCATRPPADDLAAVAEFERTNDPLEPANRAMFRFNQGLDRIVLRPVSTAYRNKVPEPARNSVRNFLQNIDTPITFANEVLQLKLKRAGISLARLVINTTIGIGGLFDPARTLGLEYNREDFGQTLGRYGVPEGPFLMAPMLGPTNPRDATARFVDTYINPVGLMLSFTARLGISTVGLVDDRSRTLTILDELERSSVDFYAAARSAMRQRRRDAVNDGGASDDEADDLDLEGFDFGDDFDEDF